MVMEYKLHILWLERKLRIWTAKDYATVALHGTCLQLITPVRIGSLVDYCDREYITVPAIFWSG